MRTSRLLSFACVSLLAFAAGCGTPGAPQPPSLDLARPVENLAASRKGNRVILDWAQPRQTTDRQNIRRPGTTRICRAINQFPIERCVESVVDLNPQQVADASTKNAQPHVVFIDSLPANVTAANAYATYAIEVLNQRGRSAGLSNQIRVPLAPTLPPPHDLSARVTAQGIAISWTGVTRASAPAGDIQFRYRLLRRPAGQGEFGMIEEVPLNGPVHNVADRSFDWEQTYEYKVAAVTSVASSGSNSDVEGDDSAAIKVFAHDTFPPAQATGLQAVYSGVGQKPFIDLTWAPNNEPDLAGYNVFRHEQGAAPQKINAEPVRSPSFRDTNVQPGRTYFYSVAAVDLRNNEGEHSEEASETVPEAQ